MADKRCFVQFPHPGGEHAPDRNAKVGWNKTHRNNKANPHKRKFLQVRGEWIDKDGGMHCGDLWAWGEWEPESECIREFYSKDAGRYRPRYLWKPYWFQKNAYCGLHNTDPFIFGDRFLYSNCRQTSRSLRSLACGSVIAFGSTVHRKFALDTVLVVRDSFRYDPLDPRKVLEGEVSEAFLGVTGGPLGTDRKLKELAEQGKPQEFRLYRGATPNDPVCGMYSFFPAMPAGSASGFPRPPITGLPVEYINPSSHRAPKGATRCLDPDQLRHLWGSLVERVRKAGLVVGIRAEVPECRTG